MIVMVGTAPDGAGGVASVIATYATHGLLQRWPVVTLTSHVVGSKGQKLAAFLGALLRFIGLLVQRRVTLVHLHASADASFWRKTFFALLALACRKPVILHLHSGLFVAFYQKNCGPLRRFIVRFVMEYSARVIALSPSWQMQYLAIAPCANIVCIPNTVLVKAGGARRTIARNVLFLGQISAEKGVFDLLAAWPQVLRQVSDARLILAGDGEMARARQTVNDLGIAASVELPGWVSGVAKQSLLENADINVLPSYFEGMPMGLLEAFALGIPCVASRVGGIPDMLTDGVEGRLVDAGDVPALAAAIIEVLSHSEQYACMSRAASERFAENYSANVVMPKLERLYAELGAKELARVA